MTFPILKSTALGNHPKKVFWNTEAIAIFRGKNNTAHALHDTCPHRNAALSDGWVSKGRLVCPWHLWEFDQNGQCQWPPNIGKHQCKTVPITEYNGWIWLGLPPPYITLGHLNMNSTTLSTNHPPSLQEWAKQKKAKCINSNHVQLTVAKLSCNLHLYTSSSDLIDQHMIGIWYPKLWSSTTERPRIQVLMDDILSSLENVN